MIKRTAVWHNAPLAEGHDPRYVRQDVLGALIHRDQYGNDKSRYGWEIDHIIPLSKNGSDDLDNLQALQWQNNRRKSDRLLFAR